MYSEVKEILNFTFKNTDHQIEFYILTYVTHPWPLQAYRYCY